MKSAIVTGAGGFIGSHFVKFLRAKGYQILGIDIKYPEFSPTHADRYILADLTNQHLAFPCIGYADELYMFAADMGGVGYLNRIHAKTMHDNVLINVNTLEAAVRAKIPKVFFASSACVYPLERQKYQKNPGLKESDAIPANPDSMYGWEKLFSERMCLAYAQDHKLKIRIARLHNIYGPEGTYQGGREKSPAAICRKIARAKDGDVVKIWGDGKQTRSYCYIDDCCEGIFRLMQSSYALPMNIGSGERISINKLVDVIACIARKTIKKSYDRSKPQGVRGRNSDNTMIKNVLGWEPKTALRAGMEKTYNWIEKKISQETSSARKIEDQKKETMEFQQGNASKGVLAPQPA